MASSSQAAKAVVGKSGESRGGENVVRPIVRLCCLKACLKEPSTHIIDQDESRVEVRAFEPKSQKNMVVNWRSRGEAMFHTECWLLLLLAAKGVNKTNIMELTDMECSMIKEASKTAEYHDSKVKMKMESVHIADFLKNSQYAIAFTGAGISTAAGIGDFRGKDGKWTDREKEKNYGAAAKSSSRGFVIESLRPTYTHEALVKLMEMGILKFLISQNTDGLHQLSGVPPEKISELHGNSFVEKCETCGHRYVQDFACRRASDKVPPLKCPRCKINHRTGRLCSQKGCNGYLMNTIINFGDYLEEDILGAADHHACQADIVLVLGSTLRVSPANSLVVRGRGRGGDHRIIICNRQSTPYDEECNEEGPDGLKMGSRVFGDCDGLMQEIMKELLSPADLQQWQEARSERLLEYDLRRSNF